MPDDPYMTHLKAVRDTLLEELKSASLPEGEGIALLLECAAITALEQKMTSRVFAQAAFEIYKRMDRRSGPRGRMKIFCTDCNESASEEFYMVHREVWEAGGLEYDGGDLCLGCLETRIGRRLVRDDFTDAPINELANDEFNPKSARFKDRLQGDSPLRPLKRRPILFQMGKLLITPGAAAQVPERVCMDKLMEHTCGNYGLLHKSDWPRNAAFIADKSHPGRVQSEYLVDRKDPGKGIFWIITDGLHTPDAVTTVLMPDEY